VPRLALSLSLLVVTVVTTACAARGEAPVPRPFPGATLPPSAPPAPAAEAAPGTSVINTALEFRGVPYRYGGSDPTGFDCSGFVQYVFARHGVAVPREVRDQYEIGEEVRLTNVRPGDLIFFETVSRGASHVGMAIGGDQFVHAPSSTGVVRVERFSSSYWASRFVGARRIELGGDGSTLANDPP
jgi:cell wall-associated NlpC family hydrolase